MTAVQQHNRSDPLAQPIAELGDDSFHDQVIRLIPMLRAFARGLCLESDEADDLCQAALTRARNDRATFLPGTNLKAWLFTLVRSQFYAEKRPSFRVKPCANTVANESLINDDGGHRFTTAHSDLVGALQRLSFEQREALILVGAAGFTYQEAAAISCCALGTIKSRVARARRVLDITINCTKPYTGNACDESTSETPAQIASLIDAAWRKSRRRRANRKQVDV